MFVFSQNRKASLSAASKAIDEIARLRLPVTPEVFAVFYAAGSGKPEAVATEIAAIRVGGKEPDAAEILAIWKRHIGGTDGKTTAVIVTEFERLTAKILEQMASENTAALESAVGDLARDIAAAGMPESVKTSLLAVVRGARNMGQRDKRINAEVKTTTSTIMKLQAELESALREAAEAKADARRDGLTKVGNRRAYDEFMEQHFKSPANRMHSFSLMMIDLDHFKKINDKHGHKFGDLVLSSAARRFAESAGDKGTVYRLGGEEFCVVLPGVMLSQARLVAERIRQDLEENVIPGPGDASFSVTVTASVGVSERRASDTPGTLYKRADKAAYRAKELGRNRVVAIM